MVSFLYKSMYCFLKINTFELETDKTTLQTHIIAVIYHDAVRFADGPDVDSAVFPSGGQETT